MANEIVTQTFQIIVQPPPAGSGGPGGKSTGKSPAGFGALAAYQAAQDSSQKSLTQQLKSQQSIINATNSSTAAFSEALKQSNLNMASSLASVQKSVGLLGQVFSAVSPMSEMGGSIPTQVKATFPLGSTASIKQLRLAIASTMLNQKSVNKVKLPWELPTGPFAWDNESKSLVKGNLSRKPHAVWMTHNSLVAGRSPIDINIPRKTSSLAEQNEAGARTFVQNRGSEAEAQSGKGGGPMRERFGGMGSLRGGFVSFGTGLKRDPFTGRFIQNPFGQDQGPAPATSQRRTIGEAFKAIANGPLGYAVGVASQKIDAAAKRLLNPRQLIGGGLAIAIASQAYEDYEKVSSFAAPFAKFTTYAGKLAQKTADTLLDFPILSDIFHLSAAIGGSAIAAAKGSDQRFSPGEMRTIIHDQVTKSLETVADIKKKYAEIARQFKESERQLSSANDVSLINMAIPADLREYASKLLDDQGATRLEKHFGVEKRTRVGGMSFATIYDTYIKEHLME